MQKIFGSFLIIVFIVLSCKKEDPVKINTELSMEFERPYFGDTLQMLKNVNIETNNDSILEFAFLKITTEDNQVLFDDLWTNANNAEIALSENKIYLLKVEVYRSFENQIKLDLEKNLYCDNRKIPKRIQIISASISSNTLLEDDYGFYVSPSHQVYARIYKDVYNTPDVYEFDNNLLYFTKNFSPESLTFNFTNLYLNTRVFTNGELQFLGYEFIFIYPLVYASGSVIDLREVYAYLPVQEMIESTVLDETTLQQTSISDSQGGGQYEAIVYFKWIYE